jgi:uncharacterized protein (DUF427 family)
VAQTEHAAPSSRLVEGVWIEPSPRRVRAFFGGRLVADSKRPLLVWEPRRLVDYWFPVEDVRMDLLSPARPGEETATARWHLKVGERVAENAAWSYPEPDAERAQLKGHIAFFWKALDAWFEEDEEVFVHPRDPYHRVDVMHSSRHVRVESNGQVLAETTRPRLLFETGLPVRYYIPKLDARMELLEPTDSSTSCPYKGNAVYWSARVGDDVLKDIVWSYPFPIPESAKIQDLLCFYNEKVDIYVDGELQERPVTPWS